jgi:hypothetical protein
MRHPDVTPYNTTSLSSNTNDNITPTALRTTTLYTQSPIWCESLSACIFTWEVYTIITSWRNTVFLHVIANKSAIIIINTFCYVFPAIAFKGRYKTPCTAKWKSRKINILTQRRKQWFQITSNNCQVKSSDTCNEFIVK